MNIKQLIGGFWIDGAGAIRTPQEAPKPETDKSAYADSIAYQIEHGHCGTPYGN